MGAFLCSPLFFVVPGLALLKGVLRTPPHGNAATEATNWERPPQTLLNPLVNDVVCDEDQPPVSLQPARVRMQAGGKVRCALGLMAVWLVVFGALTTGFSVWGFLASEQE